MGHAYVRGNGEVPLRASDTTLAQRLQANGYKTGMFGKWGLGLDTNSGAPQRKGWDEFIGYLDHRHAHHYHTDSLWQVRDGQLSSLRLKQTQYTHDVIMNSALDFLHSRQVNRQPFFLYLPLTLVHAELAPRTRTKSLFFPPMAKVGSRRKRMYRLPALRMPLRKIPMLRLLPCLAA